MVSLSGGIGVIPTGPVVRGFSLGTSEREWAHPATASPNMPATNFRFMIGLSPSLEMADRVEIQWPRRNASRSAALPATWGIEKSLPSLDSAVRRDRQPGRENGNPAVEIGYNPLGVDRRVRES